MVDGGRREAVWSATVSAQVSAKPLSLSADSACYCSVADESSAVR